MAAETDALGKCTECGKTYAVFRAEEDWHPVGTDGTCSCGNGEFTALADSDSPSSEGRPSSYGES